MSGLKLLTMENKINYARMIIGGVLAAVVLVAVGFLVHGVLLKDNYMFFQTMGSVLPEPGRENGMLIHSVATIISGLCLSMLYVVARKFGDAGPMTAIKVGFTVGLFTIGGVTAEYVFYNFGGMIPLMTLVSNIVGSTLATLAAGMVYKD